MSDQKQSTQPGSHPAQWDHRVEYVHHPGGDYDSTHSVLERMGNDGWELAAARNEGYCAVLYFKRPRAVQS